MTAPAGGPADTVDPVHAAAFASALAAMGIVARVAAESRLALVTAPADAFATARARQAAIALARAQGFTHVALLLDDDAG